LGLAEVAGRFVGERHSSLGRHCMLW
jgi:hypothetical protein